MSVRMLCLGRHWNARTYSYDDHRTDIDGLPAPALPPELAASAARAARDAGFDAFAPDVCIVNWYSAASRMGLHQDKDESPASIAEGAPVVSFSIGDTRPRRARVFHVVASGAPGVQPLRSKE